MTHTNFSQNTPGHLLNVPKMQNRPKMQKLKFSMGVYLNYLGWSGLGRGWQEPSTTCWKWSAT